MRVSEGERTPAIVTVAGAVMATAYGHVRRGRVRS
jgi:hypothetical protein